MRTALSILLAVLAGLLAALSLVGARAEALVHTPEPLQRIAGPMSEDPGLRETLPAELGEVVGEGLPDGLPGFLESPVAGLVQQAAGGLVTDERFPAAWSAALEQTRVDWTDRMDLLAGADGREGPEGTAEDAGTVHLQTAPLLDLGIERLGESVSELPGGEAVSQALQDGLQAAVEDSAVLSVDLSVPDPETVDTAAVVWTVANLYRWPWMAGTSVVLLLLALMLAPRCRRCTPLVVGGIAVLGAGVAARWALGRMGPAADLEGFARAAAGSLLEGVREEAMADTLLLIVGGGVLAALGLLTVLLSGRRSRPAGTRR